MTTATAAQPLTNGKQPSDDYVIPLMDDQQSYTVQEIAISQIVIPEGRREPKDVDTLAASIQEIGLMHPITVVQESADTYRLVAGRNRVAAFTYLERTHIPAHVVTLDTLHAELATIDENLIRNELSVLEAAEQLQRRKEIYEQLHPETGQGKRPGKAGGGKQAKTPDSGVFVPSFVKDTAKKTGKGRSTIAALVQTATELAEDVRDQLRSTPIANRTTDLLNLARMTPDKQRKIANVIVSQGYSTLAAALQEIRETQPKQKKSLFDGVGLMGFLEDVKDYAYQKMVKYEERDILS